MGWLLWARRLGHRWGVWGWTSSVPFSCYTPFSNHPLGLIWGVPWSC